MPDGDKNDGFLDAVLTVPAAAVAVDAGLSAFGLFIGLFTLSTAGLGSPIISLVGGGIAALGAWFAWRTWRIAKTRIQLAGDRLVWNGTEITPTDITGLSLRHFGTVRAHQSGGGEYQLRLQAFGRSFMIDGRLDGFERLTSWIAEASRSRLVWDARSRAYFAQFGESQDIEKIMHRSGMGGPGGIDP